MKRIKLFSLAAIFCAATFVSYSLYQQSTMTEEERLLQANIEALSQDGETGGENGNYNWGKHPCPGAWFLNGDEECCILNGENNNCSNPGECTGC